MFCRWDGKKSYVSGSVQSNMCMLRVAGGRPEWEEAVWIESLWVFWTLGKVDRIRLLMAGGVIHENGESG